MLIAAGITCQSVPADCTSQTMVSNFAARLDSELLPAVAQQVTFRGGCRLAPGLGSDPPDSTQNDPPVRESWPRASSAPGPCPRSADPSAIRPPCGEWLGARAIDAT